MATSMTLEQWGQKFVAFDADNSGSLDYKEMRNLLRSNNCNVQDSQIAEMFVFMAGSDVKDIHSCKISKNAFIDGIRCIYEFAEKVTALFKKYDKDNSGTLSPSELRKLLTDCKPDIKEETIKEIINSADKNKDGEVSLQEFINALS